MAEKVRSFRGLQALIVAMVVLLGIHLLVITKAARTADPTDQHNLVAIPIIGALFALTNAVFLMGSKRAIRLFVIAAGLGWLAEEIGVRTGLIFGIYHYTDKLGPKLGEVPMVIPLFWFMLIYLGYVIANLIACDSPEDSLHGFIHNVWVSLLGGLIVTAYDLGLDPYMASPQVGAWVWNTAAEPASMLYFGIPVRNFYGWILVSAVGLFVLRALDSRAERNGQIEESGLASFKPRTAKLIALIPVVYYVTFWLQHAGHNYTPPVVVVSLIALGIPAMAAVSNWRRWEMPGVTVAPPSTTARPGTP